MNKIVVLGKNGNLSKSFQRRFPNSVVLNREIYMKWLKNEGLLETFFSKIRKDVSHDRVYVLNCTGIVDSRTDLTELMDVNLRLPLLLSQKSTQLDYCLVTFGTVMESLPKYCQSNNYLKSKYAFYKEYQANRVWLNQNFHFQLHTLFGGDHIQPALFLGQIYQSIIHKKDFYMGNGEQLREYHFLEDVTQMVERTLARKEKGVVTISHGKPHKLGELAKEIFQSFNLLPLLKVNAISTSKFDNVDKYWQPSEGYVGKGLEEITNSIITWMKMVGEQDGK